MGCGMGVIKYLLFIFNFIFVLCGLAILVLGVLVHLGDKNYYNANFQEITGNVTFPAITLIVLGTIIFIIAFFGCCGAIRESHCMVITFASLLLTILIIQVAVAIYAFVVLKDTEDIKFKEVYGKIFNKYSDSTEDKHFVDFIQQEFECCGINEPGDYSRILKIPIPGSCCHKNADNETCGQSEAYKKGCAGELQDLFKYVCAGLGGAALGIAAIELVGIIFALCLANSIKNAERRGYSV
ncbi:CD63 antigen-like [Nylanderia fulva]|uniref:CD63 antigen-like n=1 Tax=Nylanderia fulva TaxID=613905 RepID=UPI0010FADB72|nr:CD63 antigen-like [Nylanderia fulva]